ncbi:MAG: TIGR01906 family membrane protein [Eubacteriales bacterium]|nr:TIGR01906 family membrane protein [Eubacteriales bacterium]
MSAVYGAVLTLSLILLIFSAAVSVPLLWRGFYYIQINALHLTEITPWSYDEIRCAFDQMMDFCMKGAEFGTGVLKWSEDGMQHFADCRVLFMLDIRVLIMSAVLSLALIVYAKRKGMRLSSGDGSKAPGPFFFAGAIPMAVFAVICIMVVFVDFDHAFVTFHHMFFPGKDNWLFDPYADEIINVLPEVFFMNCAILIVVLIFIFSIISIVIDRKKLL